MHSRWQVRVNRAVSGVPRTRLLDPNDRTHLTKIGDSESGQEPTSQCIIRRSRQLLCDFTGVLNEELPDGGKHAVP